MRFFRNCGRQDRILVLPGDGELDVIDIKKVSVDTSDCLLVDEEGPMDPEEMGTEDGFPLGDGGLVPETAVAMTVVMSSLDSTYRISSSGSVTGFRSDVNVMGAGREGRFRSIQDSKK